MSYKRSRFVREESWRYKRVKERWRAPHGKTSRVRRSKEGWPPVVKIGYSRPRATRGRHPSGFSEVMIWRPKDLEGIDPKTQVARIAHTVGENKRVQILEDAKKANIRILNPGLKKPAEAAPEVVTEPAPEPSLEPSLEPGSEPSPETAEAVTTETGEAATTETTAESTEKPQAGTKEVKPPTHEKAKKKGTGAKSKKKRSKK